MYAAADYRYGNYNGMMESGTAAMEAITAVFVGPMCFLVALAASQNWGCRHPLQILLCTCQIYGLTWFTLQPIFSDTGIAGHFSSDPVRFEDSYTYFMHHFYAVNVNADLFLGYCCWLQCSLGNFSYHLVAAVLVGDQQQARRESR